MAIALLLLRYLWPFLLLGGAYWWADDGWCNHACVKQKSAVVAAQKIAKDAKDALSVATQQANAQIAHWQNQAQQANKDAQQRAENDHAQFQVLQARASALQSRVVTLSSQLSSVLADASRQANASPAAPGDQAPPAAVPGTTFAYDERALGEFVTQAAEAYRDAVNQWQSCVDYYGSLQ